MSLRFVCIEVRKNLGCANVFLQFDQSLTETEFLKINVEENALRLREYSTETCVPIQYFTIDARSMSNLTVEECNASFRLTIDNIKDDIENVEQKGTKMFTPQLHTKFVEGSEASIHCANCENNLTMTTQKYERIREFPSGSIDMSEFFCHHGPDFGEVLVPQTTDFFYGFQFIILNAEQLQKAIKEKENHIYCRRCLQYLGETLFNGKAVKLWSDTVRLKLNSDFSEVFNSALVTTPTCQLLYKIINESTVAAEPLLQQIHFSKVLLEATLPNRQRKYLLLHILEKELQVLRNNKPLAHGSHNNNNILQVQLENIKCFKLLYRLMDGCGDGSGKDNKELKNIAPLLAYWQQDISISSLKISPTLFTNLLQELKENSFILPEMYRYTRDDFQLSYIFYTHIKA